MTVFSSIMAVLTWSALALLVYTYVGYPIVLWLAAKLRAPLKTSAALPSRWPTVSVVISAYNEEAVIARRIQNLLDQDFPQKQVEILIGSDGSTDATCEIVAGYRFAGVTLAAFQARRGKANVLNDLVARAKGEFVVFTDAATVFHPNALKELIRGFWRYPSASVIAGRLELQSSNKSEALYWRYELFLREHESMIGAGLGASGTIYAIRRRDYCPLPPNTIADDLLEPLLIRLRTQGHVVLHSAARSSQLTPPRVGDEFRRRVRCGSGMAHALREAYRLLLPQSGVVALALWSHKVLRLFGAWMLVAAMTGNIWLLQYPVYRWLFAMQALVYGTALCAGQLRTVPLVGKWVVAVRYFVVLNSALAMGALKALLGMTQPMWAPTERLAEERLRTEVSFQTPARQEVEKRRHAA